MDVSWMISLLLGLPVAVLALLKIIDWCKKRLSTNRTAHRGEQLGKADIIREEPSLMEPVDQAITPIIRQAELAAEVDKQIVEELSRYEVKYHHRNYTEESLPHSKESV